VDLGGSRRISGDLGKISADLAPKMMNWQTVAEDMKSTITVEVAEET